MGKQLYKDVMIFKEKRHLAALGHILNMMEENHAPENQKLSGGIKEEIDRQLEASMEKIQKELKLFKRQEDLPEPLWDFSKVRNEEVFVEDEQVLLRPIQEEHKEEFLKVKKENASLVQYKPEEEQTKYWEDLWKETKEDTYFCVEILGKESAEFLGYAAVKNTKQPLWELSIELLESQTGRGYGSRAFSLFVHKLAELTKITAFQALVEPDNLPSQRMMRQIGAQLSGVVDLYFADEEDAAEFEKEHLGQIDDQMRRLASELGIAPEKLLSRVLDYRIAV